MTELPDLYLHPGIESFDRTKRLVLVTQGTIANRGFGQGWDYETFLQFGSHVGQPVVGSSLQKIRSSTRPFEHSHNPIHEPQQSPHDSEPDDPPTRIGVGSRQVHNLENRTPRKFF